VPAKPTWYSNIDSIIREIETNPRPFVDRATVEFLLNVGRRRAQQIMAPCIIERFGATGLADRQRRRKVAEVLMQLQKERRERPQLLVEAPVNIVSQQFANLPSGVRLEPGRITLDFDHAQQALEKLLALAMAIGNDFERFEREIRLS
jgi:hypothetical protein